MSVTMSHITPILVARYDLADAIESNADQAIIYVRRTKYLNQLVALRAAVDAEIDAQRKDYWEQHGVTPG